MRSGQPLHQADSQQRQAGDDCAQLERDAHIAVEDRLRRHLPLVLERSKTERLSAVSAALDAGVVLGDLAVEEFHRLVKFARLERFLEPRDRPVINLQRADNLA